MSLWTMRNGRLTGDKTIASQQVLTLGDWLKMRGVYASRIAAEVVDH